MSVFPLLARLCACAGFLSAVCFAAGVGDLPRFSDRGSKLSQARLDAARQHPVYDLSSMPVYFEKDPAAARFQTRTATSGLLFDEGGFWVRFGPVESSVHVQFPGARPGAKPEGQQALPAFSNYFVGDDPSQWSARRQHYAGVRYDGLWPGIDLVFYAQRRELEYDFNVAPHADAGKIRLQVDGADTVSVDEHGELWIANQYGKTRQRRPVIYQEVDGRRVAVAGGYRLEGMNQVGFWLEAYDHSRELVIDPVLEFATFIGGRGYDFATAVAVDNKNNVYVTGYTQFADFKTTPAPRRLAANQSVGANVFLMKLDATTKQIVYIDFFGGSVYDIPLSVAVDSTGAATIVGETLSPNLPTVSAILSAPSFAELPSYGFAARFVPDGSSLAYSTYTAQGSAYGVALNSAGAAWVVGTTICFTEYSDPVAHEFQPTSGAQQTTCTEDIDSAGYLMQIAPNGVKQYASYYMPAETNGYFNYINDAAVDSQDNVYVAGTMAGLSLLNRAVLQPDGSYANQLSVDADCEVTKFDKSGHRLWLLRLGGSRDEECLRIAVDASSNAYVTGYTTSQNFPVTTGAFRSVIGKSPAQIPNVEKSSIGDLDNRPLFSAFVSKIAGNGATGQLSYSSYMGGNGDDYAWGIAVTGSGIAYVTGYTNSRDFFITPGAVQTTYGGGQGDAFVTGVSADGKQRTMSTFFGGSGQDEGYQVALDTLGNVYLAGGTESSDLPVTSDAIQSTVQGIDGMVAKFNLQTCIPTVVLSNPVLGAGIGSTNLTLTTDVPGCAWTLGTTASWIQFNPASGSGDKTVAMTVTANTSTQSRLAILTANSRRTFVYQSGQSACQYVVQPGEMALTSNSERHQIVIQAADPSCAWTATPSQSWLHLLSPASGKGTGAITIGTDQNNTAAVRTATLSIGGQSIVVGQSAGGCAITLTAGALDFSPAGGLGTVNVLAGSNQCSWQAQTANSDWIGIVANTNYGSGRVRFSVLPNTTAKPRTGVISVGSQTATITQDTVYTNMRADAASFTSSGQTAKTAERLSPAMVRGSRRSLGQSAEVRPEGPGGTGSTCGTQSVEPAIPTLNSDGDPVTFTVTRDRGGCQLLAYYTVDGHFSVTPASVPDTDQSKSVTFTVRALRNTDTKPIPNTLVFKTSDPGLDKSTWKLAVTQLGVAKAPLSVPNSKTLLASAGSDAIPIASTTGSPCDWKVQSSVPAWMRLSAASGTCGSQLQFNYDGNTSLAPRTATVQFETGEAINLEQPAPVDTPCTYSFQQTTAQNVGLTGGPVTLNVQTTANCTWTASTDSPDWITVPSSIATGPGQLVVQAGANDTTSKRTALVSVGAAKAWVTEDPAPSFPASCVYTLSPTSNSFPTAGGPFTFQVQTTADCAWQASQPTADASFVHLQSTASVTGSGPVTFTVDANPAGGAARSSSITVATGVNFAITQAPGTTQCNYSVSPTSTSFTSAGGSFTFQVQAGTNCPWQASQPSSDTWVHIQTASGNGPGAVAFTVDANPAGSAVRSSSISVATGVSFTFTEAAGVIPGCIYSVSPTSGPFTNSGGSSSFQVKTTAGCGWQTSLPAADTWVHIQTGSSGNGPGTVTFNVDGNPAGSAARSSSITVAPGVSFGISEAAGPTPSCSYALSAGGQSFPASGGSGTVAVTTAPGCAWSASGGTSWLLLSGAASGTGSGGVAYSVGANTAASARSAGITIGGLNYVVQQEQPIGSTFPLALAGSMAQLASGGDWDTALTLLNAGSSPSPARLNFFGDDGNPLLLPLNSSQSPLPAGPLLAATADFTLGGNSLLVLDSQQPAQDTQVGSAQLLTPSGTGGAAQAAVQGYAIFKVISTGQQSVVPLDPAGNAGPKILAFDNSGSLATGLALANVSAQGVAIPVIARDDAGTRVLSDTINLPGSGHASFLLGQKWPALAGKRGTVEFDTPAGGAISVLGLRANGAALTTLPVVTSAATTSGGGMAQVASGGGWQTIFTLVNTGSTPAQAQVRFFGDDGAALQLPLTFPQTGVEQTASTVNQTLAPGAIVVIQTQGLDSQPVVTGWAQLSGPGQLSGFAIFQITSSGQEAVVPLQAPGAGPYTLAFDNTSGLATGLALANLAGAAAAASAIVRDASGNVIRTASVPLPANGHTSFVLTDKWSETAGIRGTVQVQAAAGGAIGVLGIRATSSGAITTIPVFAASGSPAPGLPAGTLQASPNPLNVCSATASANVTLTWSTTNVTSVKVTAGSLTGTVVATGGASGSATVSATPGTTYFLVDTSGGGTPATANVLSTVTMQQGTCTNQPGAPAPTNDLAETTANWQMQCSYNGERGDCISRDDTSPADILSGNISMYVASLTANQIMLTRAAPGNGWDLSKISTIQMSLQSSVPPGLWVAGSPYFRLVSANGTLTLTPLSPSAADHSYFDWTALTAPLSGNSNWSAVPSGQFNAQNVTSIQLVLNVLGINWGVLLDSIFLK